MLAMMMMTMVVAHRLPVSERFSFLTWLLLRVLIVGVVGVAALQREDWRFKIGGALGMPPQILEMLMSMTRHMVPSARCLQLLLLLLLHFFVLGLSAAWLIW